MRVLFTILNQLCASTSVHHSMVAEIVPLDLIVQKIKRTIRQTNVGVKQHINLSIKHLIARRRACINANASREHLSTEVQLLLQLRVGKNCFHKYNTIHVYLGPSLFTVNIVTQQNTC